MNNNRLTIAIFGVGLIGGSLALSFKNKPNLHVIGHSNNPASVEKYKERGVVNEATTSFEHAAQRADVIFLCVPVGNIERYLEKLSGLNLKDDCIITDVGSTKATIVARAESLSWVSNVHFIGGHPMAGSERSGVEAASSHLFENAFYVLTPHANTPQYTIERLESLLHYTKAQVIRMDAAKHDEIVGAISHLPHIIAAALVNQVAKYNESNDLYERLAAGGFRDITRIASSEPILWRDILMNNREVVLQLLHDWNEEISQFIEQLRTMDGDGVEQQFRKASEFRSRLPEKGKGLITSIYDVYVDVPDHPGIIGQITTELGLHYVNLSNIEIIESRGEVPGVLRLSFRDEKDQEKAIKLLKKLAFPMHF